MEAKLTVVVRWDSVTIQEAGAEPVTYTISDDSMEVMAWDVGQAVSDYLEGLG